MVGRPSSVHETFLSLSAQSLALWAVNLVPELIHDASLGVRHPRLGSVQHALQRSGLAWVDATAATGWQGTTTPAPSANSRLLACPCLPRPTVAPTIIRLLPDSAPGWPFSRYRLEFLSS